MEENKKDDFSFSQCERCKAKWYKRLKRWCIVLIVLAFFGGVFFGLFMCLTYDHQVVSASAEEIDVPDIMDGTIEDYNIENYPTANYFDISTLKDVGTLNTGVSVEVSNGLINSIIIESNKGNHYAQFDLKLKDVCPFMRVGEYYTFSCRSTHALYDAIYLDGAWTSGTGSGALWFSGASYLCTEEMLDSNIVVYGNIKQGQRGGISEIMINKGTTAYPYTPYYKTLYNAGYTAGYDSGKLVGQQTALNGIFANATISGYLEEPSVSSVNFDFGKNFNFVSGGIDFSQFVERLEDIAEDKWGVDFSDPWEMTHFDINLSDNVPLNQIDLMGQGNSLSFIGSFTVTDVDGNLYRIGWTYPETPYQPIIPSELKNQNILIKTISFYFPQGSDGLYVTIFQKGLGYESGYVNGYNDGRSSGYDTGYNIGNKNGYTQGLKEGESVGYDKGYLQGLEVSEKGSLVNLIGVMFDAPLNGSLKLLNFEIMGVNMLGFFTGCLTLLFVLKVLGMFLHGR